MQQGGSLRTNVAMNQISTGQRGSLFQWVTWALRPAAVVQRRWEPCAQRTGTTVDGGRRGGAMCSTGERWGVPGCSLNPPAPCIVEVECTSGLTNVPMNAPTCFILALDVSINLRLAISLRRCRRLRGPRSAAPPPRTAPGPCCPRPPVTRTAATAPSAGSWTGCAPLLPPEAGSSRAGPPYPPHPSTRWYTEHSRRRYHHRLLCRVVRPGLVVSSLPTPYFVVFFVSSLRSLSPQTWVVEAPNSSLYPLTLNHFF